MRDAVGEDIITSGATGLGKNPLGGGSKVRADSVMQAGSGHLGHHPLVGGWAI